MKYIIIIYKLIFAARIARKTEEKEKQIARFDYLRINLYSCRTFQHFENFINLKNAKLSPKDIKSSLHSELKRDMELWRGVITGNRELIKEAHQKIGEDILNNVNLN